MHTLFVCGSHPRHAYIARILAETGTLIGILREERGALLPSPPPELASDLRKLFLHHFQRRKAAEQAFFGDTTWPDVETRTVTQADLNGPQVQSFLKAKAPNVLMSYGCHKLSGHTLGQVQGDCWNIHGGLSPWYRGAITHFWPSYLLEPQMTGMTVHELTQHLDGGAVVHQASADLVRGDGLHELACRAVTALGRDLPGLIAKRESDISIESHPQRTSGRLWRGSDWRPEHLRLIYEVFSDRIVDCYLDGQFSQVEPLLHRQLP